MVAIWILIRWYNSQIVFRSHFETFPIHFVRSTHFVCTIVLSYYCTSYLLWPRQPVCRHAAHSRSSCPAPSGGEVQEQHKRTKVISSEITVIATRRVPGWLEMKYILKKYLFMSFFPEWRVPPKFLCAIYVRFGINQTLTIIFFFYHKKKKKKKYEKKILINFPCLFLV